VLTVVKMLWKSSAPLTAASVLMIVALAVAMLGLAADPRVIAGAPAWLKPAKFAVSIGIYTLTLAWIFSLIPAWRRTRRIVGWITAVTLVMEMVIIGVQAFRGTTSHFNVGTLFDGVLFTIMGAAILVQTLSTVAVAVVLWRHQIPDRALGWALRLGMIITIAGALTGGLMTRPTPRQLDAARAGERMTTVGAHTVGAPDGGPGLPGTGWSSDHGDVRVPHFLGLHAVQILPILAFALKRRRLTEHSRVRMTITAAASYTALFAILLAQALRGQALLSPDALTLRLIAAWAILTIAAARATVSASLASAAPAVVGGR
jgi:hypothetical protein